MTTMRDTRPPAVTLLAFLAGFAAITGFVHTLQMFDLFPLYLGGVRFFAFDWLGAAFWAAVTLACIWLVRLLWNLDARGWLMTALLATMVLVLGVLSVVGGSALSAMMPALLIGSLGLLLMAWPGVREAFLGMRWAPAART
jgi:hypothetical protein